MARKIDVTVFEELAIITIDGFEGEPRFDGDADPIGSANYLCESYGMAQGCFDGEASPGILWTDFDMGSDGDGWRFRVLIQSDESESLKAAATKLGYSVVEKETVDEPTYFGDQGGIIGICKHPEGWIILN